MLFSLAANMRSECSVLQGDRRSNDFVESRLKTGSSIENSSTSRNEAAVEIWGGAARRAIHGFPNCRGNLGHTTQPKQKQNMKKELGHDCVWGHSRVYWDAENSWVLSRGAWRKVTVSDYRTPKIWRGEKLSFFGAASVALMNGRRTWKIGLFRDCGVVPGAWNISVFVCHER